MVSRIFITNKKKVNNILNSGGEIGNKNLKQRNGKVTVQRRAKNKPQKGGTN